MPKKLKYTIEDYTKDMLPLIAATREEVHFHQQLVDSLVDKFFDTGKLLLGFSVPALITIYSLKSNDLRGGYFWAFTLGLVALGILLIGAAFFIKLKIFTPYLENSSVRIELLTALKETEFKKLKGRDKT